MTRNTPTEYFPISVKPQIEGVYRVKSNHWNHKVYSLWKNGYWHLANATPDAAERETARSILLYERCDAMWCGVQEKPTWVKK